MINGGIYFASLICVNYVKLSLIFTFCEIYNTAFIAEQLFKLNQTRSLEEKRPFCCCY